MLLLLAALLDMSFHNMTCDHMLGPEKKPTLYVLQSTNVSKIIECLPELGKTELGNKEAAFIWQSIVEYFDGTSNVPESVLATLNWVTPAIGANEYTKLSLSDIDVIRNFGRDYNLGDDQLSAIADSVRRDFAGKRPEDYTYYDLLALRNIICAFNDSYIGRIHASAYKEAAVELGKLKCGTEVMTALAKLAVRREAFGPERIWSDDVKEDIGEVAKFLPKNLTKKIRGRNNRGVV